MSEMRLGHQFRSQVRGSSALDAGKTQAACAQATRGAD